MPKINFKGAVYEKADDMPADIRAEYDQAVRMLPDRDANGIPDLLEVSNEPDSTVLNSDAGYARPIPPVVGKTMRWAKWLIFAIIGLIVTCFIVIFMGIMLLMKSSGAYQLAIDTARSNSTVQEVLGTPLQEGLFVTGSISESGASGSAELNIPLSGSHQSGNLDVVATKEEDTWRLDSFSLTAGGQTYTLH